MENPEENKPEETQEEIVEETQKETEMSEDEEDDSMPFPRARVVKIMRTAIPQGKQLRSEVKDAMNIWLGTLLKKLAREMGNTQFGSVGIADFQRATKPYDMITDIVKDEERLIKTVEKLKLDADHIEREMSRFFHTIKGTEEE